MWYLGSSFDHRQFSQVQLSRKQKHTPFVAKMRQLGTYFLNAEFHEQFGTQLILACRLTQSGCISHMFDSCLTVLAKDVKPLLLLGAPTTC